MLAIKTAEHIEELVDGVAFIEKNQDNKSDPDYNKYDKDDDKVYARKNEAADTIKKLKYL